MAHAVLPGIDVLWQGVLSTASRSSAGSKLQTPLTASRQELNRPGGFLSGTQLSRGACLVGSRRQQQQYRKRQLFSGRATYEETTSMAAVVTEESRSPPAAGANGEGGPDLNRRASNLSTSSLGLSSEQTLPHITRGKRVIMVRHGESTWNAIGRIQGSSDFSVLTAKGESQAETSRQMLIGDKFDACFHSPLKRSARTAEIIWGAREGAMLPLWDLREIDLYGFQGLMKEEGKAKYGEQYKMWQRQAPDFEIDGHYPVRELWERARACWETILAYEGQSLLVVAHNAVNQALVATATGLGPEYFRQLLQSNCGVSVLDFQPRSSGDGPPYVCLNRLNQTPSPPLAASGGRQARDRVVLVCHGATDSTTHKKFAASEEEPLNMLGIIQSQKTAELLLDVSVHSILTSPLPRATRTAETICQVQEAADCLGADCAPRYVDVTALPELRDLAWGDWQGKLKAEVASQDRWQDQLQHSPVAGGEPLAAMWTRAGAAWAAILGRLAQPFPDSEEDDDAAPPGDAGGPGGRQVIVVGHETVHSAMLGHCLGLTQECVGTYYLDTGSISVIDFPDGPKGRGVVRCLNYTAHLGRWAVPVTRPALADEDF